MLKSIGNLLLRLHSTIEKLQSAFYKFHFPADKTDFSADFKNILEAYKFNFSRQGKMSLSVKFYIWYTLHMLHVKVGKLRSVFFHFWNIFNPILFLNFNYNFRGINFIFSFLKNFFFQFFIHFQFSFLIFFLNISIGLSWILFFYCL